MWWAMATMVRTCFKLARFWCLVNEKNGMIALMNLNIYILIVMN